MKRQVSEGSAGAGGKSRRLLLVNPEQVKMCATADPRRQATWPSKSIGSVHGQG